MSRVQALLFAAIMGLQPLSAAAAPTESRQLDAIPLQMLDATLIERLRGALQSPRPRAPMRLAVNVPTDLSLDQGRWTEDGHTAVWRARVQAIGATLMIGEFVDVELPVGAQLRWSDPHGQVVQGPYTHADINERGALWTALVPGDQALVELRVAQDLRDQVRLRLATLGYGVHDIARDGSGVVAKSGNCNIDVACSQGDPWRDQIRSVVHLQIPISGGLFQPGTTTLCSGQLINNLSQDGDALLLTATHCGITRANASDVMAYYNFQTASCGGRPDGSLNQTQRVSARLFSHVRSDHTLLRMAGTPDAAFNAYLSGFDARPGLPQSGVAIHHPSGDEKRISVYTTGSTYQNVGLSPGTTTVDAYSVRWTQGTSEGGSSGGGLWNQQRSLVGVLSAGNASCSNINGNDFFGRLDLAWDAGLGTFLDPDNSGLRSVAGRNAPGVVVGGGSGGGTLTPGVPASSNTGGGGGGAFGWPVMALLGALALRRRRNPRRGT